MSNSDKTLPISAVAEATGVGEATLRAWERRFGLPCPEREPSGHRRYSAAEVDQIKAVLRHRSGGLTLGLAIERVRSRETSAPDSIFARLRGKRPELVAQAIRSRQMAKLSRAVEEETAARAEGGLLIGAFQRTGAYRRSEDRWRDLVRGGMESFVLADFPELATPDEAPSEVPLDSGPMASEWVLICVAEGHSVCVVGRERPGQSPVDDERIFDGFLSLEPDVAREAAEVAIGLAEPRGAAVASSARERLGRIEDPDPIGQLRLSGQITSRFVAALSQT